jgi:S1-C subfamily serine protease
LPIGYTLVGGYSIPYIDGVDPGTSGSPVINGYGEVIAVNGRDRRAEGTDVFYRLSSGTNVDEATKKRMEFFSWGIDIRKFKKKQ